MSSFRPDTEFEAPSFIPLGLVTFGPSSAASQRSASTDFSALATAHGRAPGQPSAQAEPADLEAFASPAQLEALQAFEQAAFERGVASAQPSESRLATACDGFEAAIAQLERLACTSVGTNRELLLGLAGEIARRWVGEELAIDPAKFGALLDRAIDACDDAEKIRLVLHPEDLAEIESRVPERVASWNASDRIKLIPRSGLERGAFEIDGGSMSLDGHPEAILTSLRDALAVALEAPVPGGEAVSTDEAPQPDEGLRLDEAPRPDQEGTS